MKVIVRLKNKGEEIIPVTENIILQINEEHREDILNENRVLSPSQEYNFMKRMIGVEEIC